MRLDERLKITDGTDSIECWAQLREQRRSDRDIENDFSELDDALTFKVRRTKRVRDFLNDRTKKTAEAKRLMPGRLLKIESIRPSADREFLFLLCRG